LWVPTPRNRALVRERERIYGVLAEMIAGHRAADEPPDDLLGLLLRARDEGGELEEAARSVLDGTGDE